MQSTKVCRECTARVLVSIIFISRADVEYTVYRLVDYVTALNAVYLFVYFGHFRDSDYIQI